MLNLSLFSRRRACLCLPAFLAASCGNLPSDATFDYLSPCGNFGPGLEGIRIDLPKVTATTLRVGERRRVSVTVDRPRDVGQTTPQCPSETRGKSFFHRVSWSHEADGPFEVELVSCPCAIEYERLNQGDREVVAQATGPGVFLFDVTARKPGFDSLGVAAFVAGPCGGGSPADPLVECGPFALDIASFRVEPE